MWFLFLYFVAEGDPGYKERTGARPPTSCVFTLVPSRQSNGSTLYSVGNSKSPRENNDCDGFVPTERQVLRDNDF